MYINEIFYSINGEINYFGQGRPSIFIRLQGCNLNCVYCDTPQSRRPYVGIQYTITEILYTVNNLPGNNVTITGGEPLKQNIYELIQQLVNNNYTITIETNGSIPIIFPTGKYRKNTSFVVDLKLHQFYKMHKENYKHLTKQDFIKIPVASIQDVKNAFYILNELFVSKETNIALSPIMKWEHKEGIFIPVITGQDVLKNIDPEFSNVFLNYQIHKFTDSK